VCFATCISFRPRRHCRKNESVPCAH
jgi:hypothetical protein